MAIIDMGDLEQAVILEAQNHETTEADKDLQTELLDWNDWRVANEAIQEDDDIQKCVQYYYASSDTDVRTDGLESLLNDSDKMDESTEDTLSEHVNASETSDTREKYVTPVSPPSASDKMDETTEDEDTLSEYFSKFMEDDSDKMDETAEDTLSEYSNTSDTSETYMTPVSLPFSLDDCKFTEDDNASDKMDETTKDILSETIQMTLSDCIQDFSTSERQL